MNIKEKLRDILTRTIRVECCECCKLVRIPKSLKKEYEQGLAVFCSKHCEEAEARREYYYEMNRARDESI